MPAHAHEIGAYNIKITKNYVMATAKCSCSLSEDYNHHTKVFYNYDPSSGEYGVLAFEEGPSSWTSPEGMWYSTVTDVDYCLVHGKSHDNQGFYLTPYNGVINGKEVKNGYFTGKTIKIPVVHAVTVDKKHLFFEKYNNYNLFSF